MSISRQNLTIVIVTIKSENVIHQCLKSIKHDVPIIVVENSSNVEFKRELESKYQNLRCILTESNLGMGAGNNIGIKSASTDYVLIINPDVELEHKTLEELYLASNNLSDFSIMSPVNSNPGFPNYGMFKKREKVEITDVPLKVDYVDGFAMLLNKNKFKNNEYFDEKFFLYLENNDLCLWVKRNKGSVYVVPKSKIRHIGAQAANLKYKEEIELSRNWHWVWSKYYYNRKNFGLLKAFKECSLTFFSSIIKFLFYYFTKNKFKKKIYYNRASGFYNSFMGKSSWYRPNFED